MIINRKQWYSKSGIYAMRNLVNGKIYIGRSTNIYRRLICHRSSLNAKFRKHENEHLINAWNKYGEENFECFVLEYVEPIEELLIEKELLWMDIFESTKSEKGYNLRRDTDKTYFCHNSTKEIFRQNMIKRYENSEERIKVSERTSKFWKDNPDIKMEMSKKVSEKKTMYKILQLNMDGTLYKEYLSVKDVIAKNPDYKWQNIYAVCNGYKKKYMGYVWKKESKI